MLVANILKPHAKISPRPKIMQEREDCANKNVQEVLAPSSTVKLTCIKGGINKVRSHMAVLTNHCYWLKNHRHC